MEMVKQDHGPQCESIRTAMETRAALIYCFVKAAKDMGVDYLTLGRKAMYNSGIYKVQTFFRKTDKVDEFTADYLNPDTLQAFDGKLTTCCPTCLVEESTYCPLVNAWKRLTDDEKFLEELCDIAMYGDRGILSCYPEFEFSLLSTLFDSDRCQIQVTKKEEA